MYSNLQKTLIFGKLMIFDSNEPKRVFTVQQLEKEWSSLLGFNNLKNATCRFTKPAKETCRYDQYTGANSSQHTNTKCMGWNVGKAKALTGAVR